MHVLRIIILLLKSFSHKIYVIFSLVPTYFTHHKMLINHFKINIAIVYFKSIFRNPCRLVSILIIILNYKLVFKFRFIIASKFFK